MINIKANKRDKSTASYTNKLRIDGFIPAILETSLIDEVLQIGNETALVTARKLAAIEGIPGGISSGAAVAAALEVGGRQEMSGKSIVTILPSFAERYLSTALFDQLGLD